MYLSRWGRNFYVTNTYLPGSYSKLGMNILLRTRSVATNLVTSQNFQPIRCAFMLCQFGRTRIVYVATRIILLSSTAESSATSGYVAVPEHFLQNEESICINEERTRKKPSFVPEEYNRCKSITKHVIMIFYDYFCKFYRNLVLFYILSSYGKSFWSFVYVII